MKRISLALLVLTAASLLPAVETATSYRLIYAGGSIPNLKVGTETNLFIENSRVVLMNGADMAVAIPATAINGINYSFDGSRHYVGITWDDSGKRGGFSAQVDKNEYRGIVAGLEGVSGKQAVSSDIRTRQ